MILIVICCACDSKFKAEDNDNIRSKTSIAPFLTQFHVSETNNMQKTTKKVNYWKAPLIEEKEDVVYDVMTEQLLDDLKSAINDFSIDDKTNERILEFPRQNLAQKSNSKWAIKVVKNDDIAITSSPFWQKAHENLNKAIFKRDKKQTALLAAKI